MKNPPVHSNIPIDFKIEDGEVYPVFKVVPHGKFRYTGGKVGCYLVFKCPICRQFLHHGGYFGKPGGGDGHRCSHCACWRYHGYFLKEVPLEAAMDS